MGNLTNIGWSNMQCFCALFQLAFNLLLQQNAGKYEKVSDGEPVQTANSGNEYPKFIAYVDTKGKPWAYMKQVAKGGLWVQTSSCPKGTLAVLRPRPLPPRLNKNVPRKQKPEAQCVVRWYRFDADWHFFSQLLPEFYKHVLAFDAYWDFYCEHLLDSFADWHANWKQATKHSNSTD